MTRKKKIKLIIARQLFVNMILKPHAHNPDLQDELAYPLAPIPSALATPHCSIKVTTKSTLQVALSLWRQRRADIWTRSKDRVGLTWHYLKGVTVEDVYSDMSINNAEKRKRGSNDRVYLSFYMPIILLSY